MDGSDRRILVSPSLGLPNGLTLSRDTNELCYTDAGTSSIYCIDLSKSSTRKVKIDGECRNGLTGSQFRLI